MSVPDPANEWYSTPNKSIRQNVPRLGVVLHHAAMTNFDQLIRLMSGGKQVSANRGIKDTRVGDMGMGDQYRAWSLSSSYWDSALRSVETCNQSVQGWTISDASHWSLARQVAYWAERDGFYPHRNGNPKNWTVYGHREIYIYHGASYATACPGGMDLDLVTRRAQQILAGSVPADDGKTPIEIEEDEMKFAIAHRNEGNPEWSLIHPDLKHPTDPNQRGYIASDNLSEVTGWMRTWFGGMSASNYDASVSRNDYIEIQKAARRVFDSKLR